MTIAIIVIAGGKRPHLIDDQIVPRSRGADELVVVGEHHAGAGYRYLPVAGLTNTTTDALVKRDVGTLATTAEWLLYLSDDHALSNGWQIWARLHAPMEQCDVCVPGRYCEWDGKIVPLNMGMNGGDPNAPYCAGHGGLFRRELIMKRPWSTMPHDRLWDLLASREQMAMGARFAYSPFLILEDLEPEREPWK